MCTWDTIVSVDVYEKNGILKLEVFIVLPNLLSEIATQKAYVWK